jgi:single-strand DNA-binding protein
MRSFNRILILGNLGANPEVRVTPSGVKVANIRVATNERWVDNKGEKKEHTEWHRVVLYGNLAELAEKYLRKGSRVFVEGTVRTSQWQDRDGNNRYTTEVRALNMVFLEPRGGEVEGENETTPAPGEPSPEEVLDEDIPF